MADPISRVHAQTAAVHLGVLRVHAAVVTRSGASSSTEEGGDTAMTDAQHNITPLSVSELNAAVRQAYGTDWMTGSQRRATLHRSNVVLVACG